MYDFTVPKGLMPYHNLDVVLTRWESKRSQGSANGKAAGHIMVGNKCKVCNASLVLKD